MANSAVKQETEESQESQIAALLEARFGDGLMYLSKNHSHNLFDQAIKLGFVDTEGYLTRKGRSLLTRYHFLN